MAIRTKLTGVILGAIFSVLFPSSTHAAFILCLPDSSADCLEQQQKQLQLQKNETCQATLDSLGGNGTALYDGGLKFNGCKITCEDGYYLTVSGACKLKSSESIEAIVEPPAPKAWNASSSSTTGNQVVNQSEDELQAKIQNLEDRIKVLESQKALTKTSDAAPSTKTTSESQTKQEEPLINNSSDQNIDSLSTNNAEIPSGSTEKTGWLSQVVHWFMRKWPF